MLGLLCLAGCRDDSKTFSADDVAKSLRSHGFEVEVHSARDSAFDDLVDEAFPSALPKGVVSVVAARVPVEHSTPANFVSPLLVEAEIFEHRNQASCSVQNVIGACLQKGNVVMAVRDPAGPRARKALDDLG